jgi:hypothetical protein
MAQKQNLLCTLETAVPTNGQADKSNMESAQVVQPIDLENLTSLQRQRLDAAVMMLVDYLVSASSSS